MMSIRLLLCTDLDRTLLPNGPQPESEGARDKFNQLVEDTDITLVYVTGRDRRLVEDAVSEYRLPQPAYVIADVGSTIYRVDKGSWTLLDSWQAAIAPDWQGRSHDEMHQLFSGLSQLNLQEASKQNTFKLSYYLSLGADHEALMADMHAILVGEHVKAALIWSIDEQAGTGLIDVLPANASKYHAIEFLMDQLGFELANTIFAGDSGNDLAVLTSHINSVLVGNACSRIRNEAQQQALNMGEIDALYFARGGFLGMNGNYSAGILEGVAHYIPEVETLLEEEVT